jgi:serine kinase of HPr protein (carbohydrate metabolism regulator)
MPVAPGRNIAALIEVAARIHLLRQRGRTGMTNDGLRITNENKHRV